MGKAFDEIREGLEEALAYAKGDASKGRIHVPTPDPREVRERLGLTQRELADLCDMSLGAIRKWEQGHRVPRGPGSALLRILDREPVAAIRALRAPVAARRTRSAHAAGDIVADAPSRERASPRGKNVRTK